MLIFDIFTTKSLNYNYFYLEKGDLIIKKDKKLNILVDEDNLTINLKFENSEDLHRFLKKINK